MTFKKTFPRGSFEVGKRSKDKLLKIVAVATAVGALAVPASIAAENGSHNSLPKEVIIMEDRVRSPDIEVSRAEMKRLADTGATGVKMTAVWVTGQTAPSKNDLESLQNAVQAAQERDLKVILSTYPCSPKEKGCHNNKPPLGTWERGKYNMWLASLAYSLPDVTDFVVGNEPNHLHFGWPQNNKLAQNYYKFLAQAYDTLKDAGQKRQGGKDITVYGGATSSTGKTPALEFIEALGDAYRYNGRQKPIMDIYDHHPYGDNSSQMPSFVHRGDTLGIADYEKLVSALGVAFDGTKQLGSKIPITYGEYGVETVIPPHKQYLYTGREPEITRAVREATQAKNLEEAIGLMVCQQTITGLTLFLSRDEPMLERWQSGLHYEDGTPKPSLAPVSRKINDIRNGNPKNC